MGRFRKVLVANRGEIAVRVLRTARRLGYETVAVFSEADRDLPHVGLADEAISIGPAAAKESYLAIERIIAAAKAAKADAIHPGYGFLSENAAFARACGEAGLVFIGPSADAIQLMGNKRQAKIRMIGAGVPCVPGYEGGAQSDDELSKEAKRIGYPIMVKAAAGGGGRGMRVANDDSDIALAIQSARSEADNAFGNGELILERQIVGGRHVEIQVFADEHGNVVHLGERDCSVQRRHQKIVEESPSPALNPELRAKMGAVAVAAARAIEYRGAGTIEFLLDASGEFYFMEMNTRLQVEHPVTEMLTGFDLVEWQLLVAQGEPLPRAQEEVAWRGHAIEVRLCAEDPRKQFLPQTGRFLGWDVPVGEGIRVDHGVVEGGRVSHHYDSMQAKVIAHGATREEARRRLVATLRAATVFGVVTNLALLIQVLENDAFARGAYDTGFIAKQFDAEALSKVGSAPQGSVALVAALLLDREASLLASRAALDDSLIGWWSASPAPTEIALAEGDHPPQRFAILRTEARTYEVRCPDRAVRLRVTSVSGNAVRYEIDGIARSATVAQDGDVIWARMDGATFTVRDTTFAPPRAAAQKGGGRVRAPMDGKILRVKVANGAKVLSGEVIAVLEAMKMELDLAADRDGTVDALEVSPGAQVSARQVICLIQPDETG